MCRRFFMLFLSGLITLSSQAQDLAWFESASSRCSGPTSAPDVLHALGLQRTPTITAATNGHLYAIMNAQNVFVGAAPAQPVVLSKVELDGTKAQSLRGYLERQADGFEVPLLLDLALGAVAGIATPSTGGLAGATVYELFRQSQSAASLDLRLASQVVARGGQIERVVAPTLRDNKPYILLVDRYAVRLGEEGRAIVIRACEMPVKVRVEEFLTDDVHNNKSIRRLSDQAYAQFDLEEPQKDYDMRLLGQDAEFFYFAKALAGGDRVRISYRGGPMQMEREGQWRTLYRATKVN